MDATLAIAIPVFNDWKSVERLLRDLDLALSASGEKVSVYLIDDGSTDVRPENFFGNDQFLSLRRIAIIELVRNLGHQRALAVGLSHISTKGLKIPVVVMDGDGEDVASDVPLLVQKFREQKSRSVVFAKRSKRSEGPAFRVFYRLYKVVFYFLTGTKMSVGNFSVISPEHLTRLTRVSELWAHYPAAVPRARLPVATLDLARGKRYAGESKMNFVSLLIHGLSAISVYSDIVGARVLFGAFGTLGFAFLMILASLIIRFGTDWAIPGWTTNIFLSGILLAVQVIVGSMLLAFLVLSQRNLQVMTPFLHFAQFVAGEDELYRR